MYKKIVRSLSVVADNVEFSFVSAEGTASAIFYRYTYGDTSSRVFDQDVVIFMDKYFCRNEEIKSMILDPQVMVIRKSLIKPIGMLESILEKDWRISTKDPNETNMDFIIKIKECFYSDKTYYMAFEPISKNTLDVLKKMVPERFLHFPMTGFYDAWSKPKMQPDEYQKNLHKLKAVLSRLIMTKKQNKVWEEKADHISELVILSDQLRHTKPPLHKKDLERHLMSRNKIFTDRMIAMMYGVIINHETDVRKRFGYYYDDCHLEPDVIFMYNNIIYLMDFAVTSLNPTILAEFMESKYDRLVRNLSQHTNYVVVAKAAVISSRELTKRVIPEVINQVVEKQFVDEMLDTYQKAIIEMDKYIKQMEGFTGAQLALQEDVIQKNLDEDRESMNTLIQCFEYLTEDRGLFKWVTESTSAYGPELTSNQLYQGIMSRLDFYFMHELSPYFNKEKPDYVNLWDLDDRMRSTQFATMSPLDFMFCAANALGMPNLNVVEPAAQHGGVRDLFLDPGNHQEEPLEGFDDNPDDIALEGLRLLDESEERYGQA